LYEPLCKSECARDGHGKAATHARKRARRRPRKLSAAGLVIGAWALLFSTLAAQAQAPRGAVNYEISPMVSKIRFNVKASVPIEGTFEKWDAKLAFASPEPASGVLEIRIQADSVNTGSQMKDDRLKSENCFDVAHHPYITFRSSKIVQTGPHKFDVWGMVTIRGVSKSEKLTFTADRREYGKGTIKGNLWFYRKDYGLGGSVPFVTIADQVELTVEFKAKRVSGPPLLFKP